MTEPSMFQKKRESKIPELPEININDNSPPDRAPPPKPKKNVNHQKTKSDQGQENNTDDKNKRLSERIALITPKNSIDEEIFDLRFSAVFSNKKIGESFSKHLKSEFNEEPFKFLQEIEIFKQIQDKKQKIEKFKNLVENFILQNSLNELNISGKLRRELEVIYKNEKELENINLSDVFHNVLTLTKNEMYHDSFRRFVRTKECLKLIEQFKENSEIVQPTFITKYSYSKEYFDHPYIFDQDFKFFKSLFDDNPLWELIGSKSEVNVNTFFSKYNYLPDISIEKIKTVKYSGILPTSLKRAAIGLHSDESVRKNDPNITRLEFTNFCTLEELTKNLENFNQTTKFQRSHGMMEYDAKLPFPLNMRKVYYGVSMVYLSDEKMLIQGAKPYNKIGFDWNSPQKMEVVPNKGSEKKLMKTYPIFVFYANILKEIDENRCIYAQIVNVNLGGWASDESMMKFVSKDRGNSMRESFLEVSLDIPTDQKIRDLKFSNELENENFDGMRKLLVDLNIEN